MVWKEHTYPLQLYYNTNIALWGKKIIILKCMGKLSIGGTMLYYECLLDLRKDNNYTIMEMSKLLNTSKSNYQRWETGERFIPTSSLNEISSLFKVSVDYLLGITRINNSDISYFDKLNKKLIGHNIKKFRQENNLSQKELAKFLNTSQSTISAYENGHTLILSIFIYQICSKYKISADWLLGKSTHEKLK